MKASSNDIHEGLNGNGVVTGLISAESLAKRLEISLRSVWRYRSQGRLPEPVRIGGGVLRWRVREVDEWIQQGCPTLEEWNSLSRSVREES